MIHMSFPHQPKKSTLQCEKTICILTSTEDIFATLQHCLACKERKEPMMKHRDQQPMICCQYKMTNEGLFELNGSESIQSSLLFPQMAKLRPQEIRAFANLV